MPLADAIGTAAKDHDLPLLRRQNLIFVAVARIVVRREGFEFGRAGIHESIRGLNIAPLPIGADGDHVTLQNLGQLGIGETKFLRPRNAVIVDRGERLFFEVLLHLKNLFELVQKPRIDLREIENFFDGVAGEKRVADVENPIGVGRAELLLDDLVLGNSSPPSLPPPPKPREPISSERNAFCIDSLNVRPIAIASPTDFIAEVRVASASGIFRT